MLRWQNYYESEQLVVSNDFDDSDQLSGTIKSYKFEFHESCDQVSQESNDCEKSEFD